MEFNQKKKFCGVSEHTGLTNKYIYYRVIQIFQEGCWTDFEFHECNSKYRIIDLTAYQDSVRKLNRESTKCRVLFCNDPNPNWRKTEREEKEFERSKKEKEKKELERSEYWVSKQFWFHQLEWVEVKIKYSKVDDLLIAATNSGRVYLKINGEAVYLGNCTARTNHIKLLKNKYITDGTVSLLDIQNSCPEVPRYRKLVSILSEFLRIKNRNILIQKKKDVIQRQNIAIEKRTNKLKFTLKNLTKTEFKKMIISIVKDSPNGVCLDKLIPEKLLNMVNPKFDPQSILEDILLNFKKRVNKNIDLLLNMKKKPSLERVERGSWKLRLKE